MALDLRPQMVRLQYMKGRIAVEILGGKKKSLLSLDMPGQNRIKLTTSEDLQKSGKVRIHLEQEDRRVLLRELILRDIPPAGAGEPDIDLLGEYTAEERLYLKIFINNRLYSSLEIDLRPYAEREKRILLYLIPLAALFALLLALNALGVLGQKPWLGIVAGGKPSPLSNDSLPSEPLPSEPPSAEPLSTEPLTTTPSSNATQTSADQGMGQAVSPPDSGGEGSEPVPQAEPELQSVYFTPDSYQLSPGAREDLRTILPALQARPERRISIRGHCALFGNEAGRTWLSQKRAQTVAEYLQRQGWQPKVEPEILGLGGKEPITLDQEQQQQNRRVEIRY